MTPPSTDGSRRAILPHTLLIFIGGVGIFYCFFRLLQFSLSDCSIFRYAEVTESQIEEFVLIKFVPFPWALASGCISSLLEPLGIFMV